MSTLHTINKSPFTHNLIESCLLVCNKNDSILLIEDGVYLATHCRAYETLTEQTKALAISVYALTNDIEARGLSEKLIANVSTIDYKQFVALTVEHQTIQSWY